MAICALIRGFAPSLMRELGDAELERARAAWAEAMAGLAAIPLPGGDPRIPICRRRSPCWSFPTCWPRWARCGKNPPVTEVVVELATKSRRPAAEARPPAGYGAGGGNSRGRQPAGSAAGAILNSWPSPRSIDSLLNAGRSTEAAERARALAARAAEAGEAAYPGGVLRLRNRDLEIGTCAGIERCRGSGAAAAARRRRTVRAPRRGRRRGCRANGVGLPHRDRQLPPGDRPTGQGGRGTMKRRSAWLWRSVIDGYRRRQGPARDGAPSSRAATARRLRLMAKRGRSSKSWAIRAR